MKRRHRIDDATMKLEATATAATGSKNIDPSHEPGNPANKHGCYAQRRMNTKHHLLSKRRKQSTRTATAPPWQRDRVCEAGERSSLLGLTPGIVRFSCSVCMAASADAGSLKMMKPQPVPFQANERATDNARQATGNKRNRQRSRRLALQQPHARTRNVTL